MTDSEIQFSHSPVLFCDNVGRGLHFLLKTDSDKKEALVMMIKHGGGIILTEPSDYSITLVSPDYSFDETFDEASDDVYSIQYIEDCCTQNKILHLLPYRLNNKSLYPDDFDVMDAFLKHTTWENALQRIPFTRTNYQYSSSDSTSDIGNSDDSFEGSCRSTSPVSAGKSSPRSSESSFADSIELALDAELSSIPPHKKVKRSSQWNSLSVNVPDSPENRICDLSEVSTGIESPNQKQTSPSIAGSPSSNCSKMETTESDYDDDKSHSSKNKSNNEEALSVSSENEISSTNTVPSTKTKEKNLQEQIETSDSDDSDIAPSANQTNVRKRKEYTEEERKKIVEFISTQKAHSYVKGREFWMKMVAKKVVPGRSWQSLKEHFCKQIIPRIDKYNLKEEEITKFKKPFL